MSSSARRPAARPVVDRDAAARAASHATAAAQAAGLAAGAAAEALGSAAGVVVDVASVRGREVGREVARAVRDGAELLPTPEVLEGVLEDAFERGADAWDALRGRRRPPRRWPWATGSALVGAALAVGATVLVRRLATRDEPGAQEPEQVRAVVDTTAPVDTSVFDGVPVRPVTDAPAPAGPVDEDGEAV